MIQYLQILLRNRLLHQSVLNQLPISTQIDYALDGVGNRHFVGVSLDVGGVIIDDFSQNYLVNEMNEYDDAGGGGGARA